MGTHDPAFDLFTTPEAADVLRSKPKTMERWRTDGGGPVFVRIGGRVAYRRADLVQFIEQNRVQDTSKETGAGRLHSKPTGGRR